MKEHLNYGWFSVDGLNKEGEADKYYYLTDAAKALSVGYFKTEDTNEVFKVTGYRMNTCPIALIFEKTNIVPNFKIPVAKVVPSEG